MSLTDHQLAPFLLFASVLCAVGILPVVFGLASIASTSIPMGNAIAFLAAMGGPGLMFASGLRLYLKRLPLGAFFIVLGTFLVVCGLFFFRRMPNKVLFIEWVAMSLAICVAALILRRSYIWAMVGGAWAALLLAAITTFAIKELFFGTNSIGLLNWNVFLWSSGFLAASTAFVVTLKRKPAQWTGGEG